MQCAGHLVGQVDFIWAAAVLHVLSRQDCELFLRNTKQLLKPGGSVYGWTVGNAEPRDWVATPDGKQSRYLHSTVSCLPRTVHVNNMSAGHILCG